MVWHAGFRDSSHLFGWALSQDLLDLDLGPGGKIIQYVDDLLICSADKEGSQWHMVQVLTSWPNKISRAKAQLVQSEVFYLGVHIACGSRRLSSDWLRGLLQLSNSTIQKQLLGADKVLKKLDTQLQSYSTAPLWEPKRARWHCPIDVGTTSGKGNVYLKQVLIRAPALRLLD